MRDSEKLDLINDIKSKFGSVLLIRRSITDEIPYTSPNFLSWVYNPFKKDIEQILNQFPKDEITVGHLGIVLSFLDNELKVIKKDGKFLSVDEKAQIKYIEIFKKDLTLIKDELENILKNKQGNGSDTDLNREETLLLMCYLQHRKLVSPYITNIEFARAFSILSGLQMEQLRKHLSGNRDNKIFISDKRDSYMKLIAKFKVIIGDTEEDLKNYILK